MMQQRTMVVLLVLSAAGCEPEASPMETESSSSSPGKADGLVHGATWQALQTSGCHVAAFREPGGDGYAASWLLVDDEVERCTLTGSATIPAGVRLHTMFVEGQAMIVADRLAADGHASFEVTGSRGQSIVIGTRQITTEPSPPDEHRSTSTWMSGRETFDGRCLDTPVQVSFNVHFQTHPHTQGWVPSLDVGFDVDPCP